MGVILLYQYIICFNSSGLNPLTILPVSVLSVTGTVVPILYFLAMSGWSNTLITSCSTLFCVNHSPTALQGLQFGFSNFIMLMPQIYERVFVFANIIFTFVVWKRYLIRNSTTAHGCTAIFKTETLF